jgi:hypothetical protein
VDGTSAGEDEDHVACYRINDPGARRQLTVTVANAAGIAPRPSGDAVTHEAYTFAVRAATASASRDVVQSPKVTFASCTRLIVLVGAVNVVTVLFALGRRRDALRSHRSVERRRTSR